ncbi:uncharacterized protein TM35_000741030 [Trypanosoma theileri]|uniref:Mucin-associated surface protein (MASP) n=1 Tax=Trypanosoma theileri TaxID=67003 RepID=A0A1X0NF61_9TRYP|nr:uncharacterized protein TM35_000741030 [Trypanosoma theileri]ORC83356.1 hypothetical protein TM35_000741030 [Trypanosoma theileri]
MMRYVLCILALLLSCACVHVLAEEVPAADLSDQVPDTESETKILLQADLQTPGASGPGESPHIEKELLKDTEEGKHCDATLGEEAKKKLCQTPAAAVTPTVVQSVQEEQTNSRTHLPTNPEQQGGVHGSPDVSTAEQIREETGERKENEQDGRQQGDEENQKQPPIEQEKVTNDRRDESSGAVKETSAEDARNANAENDNAGANDAQSSNTQPQDVPITQPSSSSVTQSTNSDAENASETDADTANAVNGTKPAEGGSPSNQEGDVGNTDTNTTTTTTTLPPELTNNKKGDADSSSSISSSVWVRVPLLIVVTLACILVC